MTEHPMTNKEQEAADEALRRINKCSPESIALDLTGLNLTTLPPSIGQLKALTKLYLQGNRLTTLPPEISQCAALTDLNLSQNRLTTLPREIGYLQALTELNLSHNWLNTLPPELGQLQALTSLDVSFNRLTKLPPELSGLRSLTELDVSTNYLNAVPPELGNLHALRQFNLYNNKIRAFPSVPKCLYRLNLSNNLLNELPSDICQIDGLVHLHFSCNPISTLPDEIGNLRSLESLSMGNTQIEDLPKTFRHLTKLRFLAADHMPLIELPSWIGELKNLRGINLSHDQASSSFWWESGSRGWQHGARSLSHSRLQTLPKALLELPHLNHLYLHGIPALGIMEEVLGPTWDTDHVVETNPPAHAKAILAYYFEVVAQGTRPLNEVRLVLVGRGAAGKTSLVQRLVLDTFDPAQSETPGIALSDWTMRGCAGAPVTAHVWDFAGQVVTHSMHRYFLSHRTVYLLLLTQREDVAGEDADYWLKLIQSYGSDKTEGGEPPPVIVVLNKSDQAKVKVDRNFLQERFPFIVDFVETDCQSGRGIPELRERLCRLMDEPKVKTWVREGFPAQWWKVKKAIVDAQKTRPHLSYDEWRELCDKAGEKDKGKQDQLSKLLHTLGVALNYADDPRLHDNTVLRPNWVTHHCYNLIRHAADHAGVLHRAEAAEVLKAGKEGEQDPRMHDYLMRLMERFEAAYPLGEVYPPEKWLVPLGLPDDQPAGLTVFGQTTPEQAARLRYTYPSVPPGLLAQFIVRTHPLMEAKMQWANGTVLALNGARALIRAISKSEIEVTAIGDNADARRDLAGLCRDEIKGLNAQIAGLDVTERTEVIADGESVWVKMPTLEKDELKGKTKTAVETSGGSAEAETKRELDEFATEEARLPEASRFELNQIIDEFLDRQFLESGRTPVRRSKPKPRLFISYSHSDERHLKELNLRLIVLKNLGLIHKVWHDRRIQPGMDWDKAIQEEIAAADVVIFLTSTAALASGYINQEELRPALERHVKNEAVVVPIIIERCDWMDTFAASKPLKVLKDSKKRVPQGIPRDNKPINAFNPRTNGWHQVSEELKVLLTEVKKKLNERK